MYETSLEEWKVILGLAQYWGFANVKRLALIHLNNMTMELVERIELYQRYMVGEEELIEYYVELCEREEPLSFDESDMLGRRTFFVIHAARERLRAQHLE